MALTHPDWNPSEKKLRRFGAAALVMLGAIGLAVRWKFGAGWWMTAGFAGTGAVIFALSLISAKLVRPVYVMLTAAGYPAGWVASHVLMAVFFFGIITPLGLVFRLIGRDVMQRRWERKKRSYWCTYRRAESVKRYFDQF